MIAIEVMMTVDIFGYILADYKWSWLTAFLITSTAIGPPILVFTTGVIVGLKEK
jgi:hypothetical protein